MATSLPQSGSFPFPTADTTLVVICGCSGARLWPLTLEKQKAMLDVSGVPLIKHIIELKSLQSFYFCAKIPVCQSFLLINVMNLSPIEIRPKLKKVVIS
ncbi:MAG: sugar phosphate nucleotidyltransferase [Chlorobium sp.]